MQLREQTFDSRRDCLDIASTWTSQFSWREILAHHLADIAIGDQCDVVAIGKSGREMADAAVDVLGAQVTRRIVVTDRDSVLRHGPHAEVVIGDHPIASDASVRAAIDVVDFLDAPSKATLTIFLVSGGASSLCCLPQPPVDLSDLRTVWSAALVAGLDITGLNKIRAATSMISGGRILRHVKTTRSIALIEVDNVISGAQWVASGLTYEFAPEPKDITTLWASLQLDRACIQRLTAATKARDTAMSDDARVKHRNIVVLEPRSMLTAAMTTAQELGYHVVSLGESVSDDVQLCARRFVDALLAGPERAEPRCVIAVGEVSVSLHGNGRGGRCSEFAWHVARELESAGRFGTAVGFASDGRDHVRGVGGAISDQTTFARARKLGLSCEDVTAHNDTTSAFEMLGDIIPGSHTGWNLCDVYVLCEVLGARGVPTK